MALLEMMCGDCVGVRAAVRNKAEALRVVAGLAKRHPAAAHLSEAEILRGLEMREAMGSTGLVRGMALPHCRIPGLTAFAAGVLAISEGVPYGTLDGRRARLLIFVLAPAHREAEHLQAMAALSGVLEIPDIADRLASSVSAEVLFDRFAALWREHAHAV